MALRALEISRVGRSVPAATDGPGRPRLSWIIARSDCWVIASVVIGLVPQVAVAAAFQLRENDTVSVATASAGAASAADTPGTVFNNPAGMTQLPGLQVQLGAAVVAPQAVFHGTAVNALGQPIAGADGIDGTDTALVPHGYVSDQITPKLAVGIALTAPYGLSTSYGGSFVGRYVADKTSLETININPAVAYQVLPWLSLGAGVSAQYGEVEFTNFINSSAVAFAATGHPAALPDGYTNLRGSDWAFGYNFGALIQPWRQTNIGLTYRSRVQHDVPANVNFVVPAPLGGSPLFRNGAATAKVVLPDTASLSVTQHIGADWTVYAGASWTNWSQLKSLTAVRDDGTVLSSMPTRYVDTVYVSAGASYRVDEKLTVHGGAAYDPSPVPNATRSTRIPDQDRYWLALGFSYQILPRVTVDVAYAHAFVDDGRIREMSATGDVLSGISSDSIDVGSVGTRLRF